MSLFLNILSILFTFIIIEGLFYFVLNLTIGQLNIVKRLPYKDLYFILIGFLFIVFFFDFYLPH